MDSKTASIILTIHNKQQILESILHGIDSNISDAVKQVIVILDGCTDRSEQIVKKFYSIQRGYYALHLLYTPDVWETKANNVGLKFSTEPYCIIIQDDMLIQEKDFDKRLLLPFSRFSDVFAVSARTAHNNRINSEGNLFHCDLIGLETNSPRDIFGIRDSCNRGPLVLDHTYLEKLGYLDEEFSPFILDDHDLCMRAYKEFGKISGSYRISFRSDYEWGGSHASNIQHIVNNAWNKNSKFFIQRHYDALIGNKHSEERLCI